MNPADLLRNRYRIEKALAAGGFGETYLAIDLDYPGQRQVVVKHLKPAQSDPNTLAIARRLFESEAQVLAELGETSDRLPALYAYFEEQGEFYLVQEFVAGETLAVELAAGKLSETQTIEILQGILTALAVVHAKNKIHRDLKPANIMRRSTDNKLVLIDFGAVKEVRQATNLGMTSITIGTLGYMPTEQAIGRPRLASDVYAVGAIGIQCLTGQPPHELFDENIFALSWQHLCKISPGLAQVIEKMVAQQPNERYQDAIAAKEVIKQLFTASQPLLATVSSSVLPTQQSKSPIPVSSPLPTQKSPILPIQSAKQTFEVTAQANAPGSDPVGRRKFLKFLGFGGSGVIGILLLSQLISKKSTNTITSSADSKNNKTPRLDTISFTSVKLDRFGKTVNRPSSSTIGFKEELANGLSLAMVRIPAGKFQMGSPANEQGRDSNESPQHMVTVPEFYMGQNLVTQAQWQALMGSNPASFKGDDQLPVNSVSWLDAIDFCQKLSEETGHTYRLPTEAEWEYACRAGTKTPFAFGETITTAIVNFKGILWPYANADEGEYRQKTTTVGSFPANLFGLYDMHGNLYEWCLDEWQDNYKNTPTNGRSKGVQSRNSEIDRVLCGGSCFHFASSCRSASRIYSAVSDRYENYGLRVVIGTQNS
jgi:eukaryotic-like serine/threonine-protein kinase